MYKPNEIYWGLGIENETYLEVYDGIEVPPYFIQNQHVSERYSVNYWKIYKPDILKKAMLFCVKRHLPLLINGHSFSRTDAHGNSETTFSKIPRPNPKFSGKTLFSALDISGN